MHITNNYNICMDIYIYIYITNNKTKAKRNHNKETENKKEELLGHQQNDTTRLSSPSPMLWLQCCVQRSGLRGVNSRGLTRVGQQKGARRDCSNSTRHSCVAFGTRGGRGGSRGVGADRRIFTSNLSRAMLRSTRRWQGCQGCSCVRRQAAIASSLWSGRLRAWAEMAFLAPALSR